jgi:mannose-6-phosphate isomerase-like protein (cupin superfamily)
MKPVKIKFKEAKKTDLGTKIIHSYPLPTKLMSLAYMIVKGRHPQGKAFFLEHDCAFIIYVTKGKGTVYAGNEKFDVEIGDAVLVPTDNKFAVEGNMEYVTVDVPGYYHEQSEEITSKP